MRTRTRKLMRLTAAVWAVSALPASAQDISGEDLEALVYAIDTVWVALAAALVLLMHLGFAMLEAGLTRAKNAANIAAKNLITVAIGGTAYWAFGAALAYGSSAAGVLGTSGFFNPAQVLGDGTQAVFQLVFAATAATIVSGAVAERIDYRAYIVVATGLTALIYPIISHWQWGGGWLSELGFYDFAGSTIVHLTGGTAALTGAAILGPRIGKYGERGEARAIPGHNIPLAVFGVLILFFGWYGFNGGSTLAAFGQAETIGIVLLNTTIAGSLGGLFAAAVNWRLSGKPDPAMVGNGVLAGLVGITAGPDLATGAWAALVGAVCGALVVVAVAAFDRIRIDDPVGATSVHLVCGAVGTLFVGLYSPEHRVGVQALGVAAVFAFVGVTSTGLFLAVRALMPFRVDESTEVEGLDLHEHGVQGLPDLGTAGRAGVAAPGVPLPVALSPAAAES